MSNNPNKPLHSNNLPIPNSTPPTSLEQQQLPLPLHQHSSQQIATDFHKDVDVPNPPDQQIDYFHPQAANSNIIPSTPAHHQAPAQNSSSNISSTGKQRQPRKYFCKTCNQGFTRKHNMVSHELIHSSLKPHVCSICNLRFRRIHDLKRHEKLHTGEKPYSCERCSRRFARPDALTRHQNSANACTSNANNSSSSNSISSVNTSAHNSANNIHGGVFNNRLQGTNSGSQDMVPTPRPLQHIHSSGSIDDGDGTPQRPALAVNQQDERDSSATSNSTGASSNFSTNSNEPATSGDSTTTNDPNCIPTLKTIGRSPDELDKKQNLRSQSNQEFGTKQQQLLEKQQRSQSFDPKAYSTYKNHLAHNSMRTPSGPTFTPSPIYPIPFYPFPQVNNQNNHISLPPLSVPHQPQLQNSFVPQVAHQYQPHSNTQQHRHQQQQQQQQQQQHGPIPGIARNTMAYGDDHTHEQGSDSSGLSTIASARNSPQIQGPNHTPTPVKFPPNPVPISRSSSIANSFMIPSLGSRPQSLPANVGHPIHSHGFSNQGLTTSGAMSNSPQVSNSTWGPPQSRGGLIGSLPPPSHILNPPRPNSANLSAQVATPQPSDSRQEYSSSFTPTPDGYNKQKPGQ
ncbi:hypothetical protein I9W82_002510 [Candida metapsilosis]|uniref:C2H2-type domain-containing protein n=1 Tax=Candida metapsilosis TaxID=273372 RepID=A0A8H7ZIC3_9ASCO|nr:hypothetical protein I9W82_002510 [Candida metapsilosis]